MPEPSSIKILENCLVSPPAGTVSSITLPITYFDLPWFPGPPMHSVFFYEYPNPTSHFMQTALPILKRSLSLTLQHFFPLSGNIICPMRPQKPYIQYADSDSISFTVAETAADFNHLKANYPRDVKVLHPFVRHLPPVRSLPDGTRVIPVLALQVTVFPNHGFCIGATHCHVAADGISFMHFLRSWASVCKFGGREISCILNSLPSQNREAIKDPHGIEPSLLEHYWNWVQYWRESPFPSDEMLANMVRATFTLSRTQIEKLKHWVKSQCSNEKDQQLRLSTFVVTCAFMWVVSIKAKEKDQAKDDENKLCYFIYAFNCRNRLEFPIADTYFGNCIAPSIVEAKKSDLLGANGIIIAAKAIGNKVKEMEIEPLKGGESWQKSLEEIIKSGNLSGVSGSPKLRIYEIDFGWGRPSKVEFVHIEGGGALAVSEDAGHKDGIEVGLALEKDQMDLFTAMFEKNLKVF